MFQNLHTHTNFSDGSGDPEQYVESAIQLGLSAIGFSDHSPLPFENSFALKEEFTRKYCETIVRLREKYQDSTGPREECKMQSQHACLAGRQAKFKVNMQIFLGIEADFIPGMGYSFSSFLENYPFEYLIGSVHLVRNGSPTDLWFIDGPDPATYDNGLINMFGGDIRKGVGAYYRQINEMITTGQPDVIGHLDKIKMHNRGRYFLETEPWYTSLVDETLDLVRQTGVIVEVNTRGLYKKRSDSLFPGPDILKKIRALNIPVIISSDAHKPHEVAMLFDETADLLFNIGFREIMNLTLAGWESISLQLLPS